MRKPYNTEENRIKGQIYRERSREKYRAYQREYQRKMKHTPTLQLMQLRAKLNAARLKLAEYEEQEMILMAAQAKIQAEREAAVAEMKRAKEMSLQDWLKNADQA